MASDSTKKTKNPSFSHLVTCLEAASIFSPEQPHHLKNSANGTMPVKISTAQLLQRQRRPSELRYGRRRGDKCAHHCTSHRSTVHMHGCDTDPEFFSLHGRWLSKLSAALERAVETVAQRVSYGCANSRLLPHAGSRSPFFFLQAPSLSPRRQPS